MTQEGASPVEMQGSGEHIDPDNSSPNNLDQGQKMEPPQGEPTPHETSLEGKDAQNSDIKDDDDDKKEDQEASTSGAGVLEELKSNCVIYKYASFVYDYPWVIMVIVIAFIAAFSGWNFGMYGLSFQADTTDYRWSETKNIEMWDAFASASSQTFHSLKEKNESSEQTPLQRSQSPAGIIVWERKGKNILDLDVVKKIWETEDELYKTANFDKYCWKPNVDGTFVKKIDVDASGCYLFPSLIKSIKQIMAGQGVTNPKPEMLTEQILKTVLFGLGDTSNTIRSTFLGRECAASDITTCETSVIRTILKFGFPLEGYKNINDNYDDQLDKLTDFGFEFIKPIERVRDNAPNGLKGYDYVPGTMNQKISDVVLRQVLWLIGSFGITIVVVLIHLKNPVISIVGILSTFFSIPAAMSFAYAVVGIHHFDALNVLGLFLICGIGSDAIFIYFDLLRQSADYINNPKVTPKMRLANCVQRGMFATCVSAFTTAICFISLITSGARVIRFFGIFCFFLMVFDWLFGATFYVAGLAIYIKYYEKQPEPKEKNQEEEREKETKNQTVDEPPVSENPLKCFTTSPPLHKEEDESSKNNLNPWEKFFHNYFAPIVYHYRLIIVLACAIISIVFGIYTFKMVGKVEMQFLDDDHPLQHGVLLQNNNFASTTDDFSFVFVWGVKNEVKAKGKQKLTVDNFGTADFISIDFKKEENQQFLYDVCDMVDTDASEIVDKSSSSYMTCPMKDLKKFASAQGLSFPITAEYWDNAISGFQQYTASIYGTTEALMNPGMSQKDVIGFDFDTNEIKYVAVKATMKYPSSMSSSDLKPLYDKLQEFQKKVLDKAPEDLKSGYTTSYSWIKMDTQDKLVSSTLIGIIVSSAFAVVVVFISTLSFAYTGFFTFSLACTILTVLGILERMGWGIGLSEAVMLTIASGFCCDYIIQTMLGMSKEHKYTRFGRMQNALTTFCTPVSLAFFTTVGSGVFLYGCDIILFPPFATFLILSSLFGVIHGFVVLPAFASMCGPRRGDNLDQLCNKAPVESELHDLN